MRITLLRVIKMKIIALSILLSYVEQLTITQLKDKSHKHTAEYDIRYKGIPTVWCHVYDVQKMDKTNLWC